MGRKRSSKSGVSATSKPSAAPGARIKKIDSYEDTIEPGSVDEFMFKRDQISLNPQNESEDEDINADEGEEVLSLEKARRSARQADEEEGEGYEEEPTAEKKRKQKKKTDLSTKGRFGKPIVSSDEEEEEGSDSGSESEDENWGRQYYSKPSNRREKEKEGDDDEKREEERDMEEREVKRLQKKQREALTSDDFGLADLEEVPVTKISTELEAEADVAIPAPPVSADPVALLRHLEAHEPLKLALTRDFSLTVRKLEKTSKGIEKMENASAEEAQLHKGLGWLHYQTLLTYATTLAFYIHVNALPPSSRPDIPLIPRLLQLKESLIMLEDLDFDAASVSENDLANNPTFPWGETLGEDDEELKEGKIELIKRMQAASGMDLSDMLGEVNEDEDDDEDGAWRQAGLEENELQSLLDDQEEEDDEVMAALAAKSKNKKNRKAKKAAEAQDGFKNLLDDEPGVPKKKKKSKTNKESSTSSSPAFEPLAEPEFFSKPKSSKKSKAASDDLDPHGDPTALIDADFSDKQTKRRSLAFHTSKINSTLNRRAEGRASRMGGDEDLPYRDRRKARDDALKKNGPRGQGGEDLEPVPENDSKKRARDEVEDDGEGDGGDMDEAEGYYELVKRRRKEEKNAKEAEHEAIEEELRAERAGYDDDSAEGPRTITRAIEKNRGLTPRRSKTGRNPRVKKRQAYDKAQKKVASQRSVYKGGQAAYGGDYKGEKTGISKVIKSRKF